jgi:hypothetical protein
MEDLLRETADRRKRAAASRTAVPRRPTTTTPSRNVTGGDHDTQQQQQQQQQQEKLIQYAILIVGGLLALKLLQRALQNFVVWLLLPLIYLYAVSTRPSPESLDIKKELKRVLRGHHLPDNHPDKPSGWWRETVARISASVTTEIATGLGYEVQWLDCAQAAHLVTVRVPAAERDFYWLGIFHKWYYVYSQEHKTKTE